MLSNETAERVRAARLAPWWAVYSINREAIPAPLAVFQFGEGAEIWMTDMNIYNKLEPYYPLEYLLAAIDGLGYLLTLEKGWAWKAELRNTNGKRVHYVFDDSPREATALVYLWALEDSIQTYE